MPGVTVPTTMRSVVDANLISIGDVVPAGKFEMVSLSATLSNPGGAAGTCDVFCDDTLGGNEGYLVHQQPVAANIANGSPLLLRNFILNAGQQLQVKASTNLFQTFTLFRRWRFDASPETLPNFFFHNVDGAVQGIGEVVPLGKYESASMTVAHGSAAVAGAPQLALYLSHNAGGIAGQVAWGTPIPAGRTVMFENFILNTGHKFNHQIIAGPYDLALCLHNRVLYDAATAVAAAGEVALETPPMPEAAPEPPGSRESGLRGSPGY